jgi:hypothetical protein
MNDATSPRLRLAALVACAWLAFAGAAKADPAPLALVAEGYDAASAERLRGALERELGRPVVLRASLYEGEASVIARRGAGRDATVTYVAPSGWRLERGLRVQDDEARAEGEVALLASNLARDESAALLAKLPAGEGDGRAKPDGGKGRPEQVSCKERSTPAVPIGGDLVPYVGLSSVPAGRAAARWFSLNLAGGLSRGTVVGELAGAVNINTEFACGAQAAGAANVVLGPLAGVQLAGAANVTTGSALGAQAAGAANVSGKGLRGVQAAGGANVALGTVTGAQVAGGANLALGPGSGAQASGGANLALGPWSGAQLSGGFNLAGYVGDAVGVDGAPAAKAPAASPWGLDGAQVAGGANVVVGPARGVQIAPINVATGPVRGVQIGVVNVAEDADFALGLINVFPKGRLHVDVWIVPEIGLGAVALKHGGKYFHYLYGVGMRAADQKPWYAFGLGGHLPLGDLWYADADFITYGRLVPSDFERDEGRGINQLRVVGGYSLMPGLALYGGPSANVSLGLRKHGRPTGASYASDLGGSKSLAVSAWPGFVLGVQGL